LPVKIDTFGLTNLGNISSAEDIKIELLKSLPTQDMEDLSPASYRAIVD